MISFAEQIDELVSHARHVGYMEAEANQAEHAADTAPRGSGSRLRRRATEARRLANLRAEQLNEMRDRLLARVVREASPGNP